MKAKRRLLWLFAIGNQAADQIDEEIGGAAMTGMFNLKDILELVNDSLDDRAFAQQNLVKNRHELVFHVGFDTSDELKVGIQEKFVTIPMKANK